MEMAAQLTEASQDATSWSCGESMGRHLRESATWTLAAKLGWSRSDRRKEMASDRSSKGDDCKGECRNCDEWES